MSVVAFLRRLLCLGLILSLTSTTYLYLYPIFHGCAFPTPHRTPSQSFLSTVKSHLTNHASPTAPFRLLALGDPQLEGDTSLPPHILQHIRPERRTLLQAILFPLTRDLPYHLFRLRKQIDLWGNDYYLAHIHRTLTWWTTPTHVTVLGDLLGSQWINDAEFADRARRYWRKVFPSGRRVPDHITSRPPSVEILGADPAWQTRIINIVGNHDVGYSGDMTRARVDRFERAFGKTNWEVRFRHCPRSATETEVEADCPDDAPEIRLVILDSMNLDSPVLDQSLQADTYAFLNDVIAGSRDVRDKSTLTVLLTHVPLHKREGVCVDAPMVVYHHPAYGNGGVREQNHLTPEVGSAVVLHGVFGMHTSLEGVGGGVGRPGVILTGHDHEGCDVYHHVVERGEGVGGDGTGEAQVSREWDAVRYASAAAGALLGNGEPGIREITVRSMMGDFGGNAGLLSAWWEEDKREWRVEFANCGLGTQHLWWAAHITVLITVGVGLAYAIALWWEAKREGTERGELSRVETRTHIAEAKATATGSDENQGEGNRMTRRGAKGRKP